MSSSPKIKTDLKVKDLMTSEVHTIAPKDAISLIDDLMQMLNIRHIIVAEDKNLKGVVTQRDFYKNNLSSLTDADGTKSREIFSKVPVSKIMVPNPTTVSPETPLPEAAKILFEKKFGCLPVVEEGKVVGILTESDFVKAVAEI